MSRNCNNTYQVRYTTRLEKRTQRTLLSSILAADMLCGVTLSQLKRTTQRKRASRLSSSKAEHPAVHGVRRDVTSVLISISTASVAMETVAEDALRSCSLSMASSSLSDEKLSKFAECGYSWRLD